MHTTAQVCMQIWGSRCTHLASKTPTWQPVHSNTSCAPTHWESTCISVLCAKTHVHPLEFLAGPACFES